MKVWISKYALSDGLYQAEAEVSNASPDMVVVKRIGYFPMSFHGEGREWHRTEESAIARAEEMRATKIASLKKQLQKLEARTFAAQEAKP